MNRERPPASADECVVRLLRAIGTGAITADRRLGAGTLARALGVGVAPVRSALNHLEVLGLLERRPRSGTYLRKLSLPEYVDSAQVRAALEGLACRFTALRATVAELSELARLAQKLDRLAESSADHDTEQRGLELRFHTAIARVSRNAHLESLIAAQQIIARYLALEVLLEVPYAFVGPSHRDIVDGLRSRDPVRAERVMREHILGGVHASLERLAASMPRGADGRRAVEDQLRVLETHGAKKRSRTARGKTRAGR